MGRRSQAFSPVWVLFGVALTSPHPAFAWGDEGHKVTALIAEQALSVAARPGSDPAAYYGKRNT